MRNVAYSIGVAEDTTEIMKELPKNLKSKLPTVEEIEAELEKKEILAKSASGK